NGLLPKCLCCMILLRLLGTLSQYCIKLVKVLFRVWAFPVFFQALHSIAPTFVAFSFCLPVYASSHTQSAEQQGGKMGIHRNLFADLYLVIECAVVAEEIQADSCFEGGLGLKPGIFCAG